MAQETQVEIRADEGVQSLGRSAYVLAISKNFSGQGIHRSSLTMIVIGIILFFAMLFTRKSGQKVGPTQPLSAPGFSVKDNNISAKLLTEKDLINQIQRKTASPSLLGKIRIVSLRSISEIPVGSEIRAVLSSGATDGIVKASLSTPLIVDGEPILPERAVLFGKGKSGEERLFIEFTKVIFPSGEAYPIRAQAFELSDKILGLKGALVGRRTKKMTGAIAFGFLGGMTEGLQETSGTVFQNKKPSMKDAALSGASKAALDQSQVYLDEMKKSPNIIEVNAGTELLVIIDEPKKEDNNE